MPRCVMVSEYDVGMQSYWSGLTMRQTERFKFRLDCKLVLSSTGEGLFATLQIYSSEWIK